jgi:hypothetical protein
MIFVILAIFGHFLWEQGTRRPVGFAELRKMTSALIIHFQSGKTELFAGDGPFTPIAEAIVCEQKRGLSVMSVLSRFSEQCDGRLKMASQATKTSRLLCVKLGLVLICTLGVRIGLAKSLGFMHLEDMVLSGIGIIVLAGVFTGYLNLLPRETWDVSPQIASEWMRQIIETREKGSELAAYKVGISSAHVDRRRQQRTAEAARAEGELKLEKWLEYQPVVELVWSTVAIASLLGFPVVEVLVT